MHTHATDENRIAMNGVSRWLRIEVLAFIIQTLMLVGGIIYGYSKLESKVDENNRRLLEHIDKHGVYLAKESWEIRNKFVDQTLTRIEEKLDLLLKDKMK